MSKRRFGITAALAVFVLAAVAAIAVAASGGPKTDKVQATFTATLQSTKQRTCTGQDGAYADARDTYKGTITGDPRLTGDIVIRSHTLVNTTTGDGTTAGHFWIKQTGGRRTLAAGTFQGVDSGATTEGFTTGRITGSGGARLWANFTVTGNADGSQLSGSLGGGGGNNTAVIQVKGCHGSTKPAKHSKPAKQHPSHPAHPAKPPKP
jgi:hypothetical protein